MSTQLAKVTQLLDDSRPTFEEMNLNRLDFNKEREFMVQAFQNNPYLLGMSVDSVRNILINCALTGLSLNPVLQFAYPVPRKGKLCLDVSYKGMIKIVTDTGSVKSIKANVVYSNEPFDIDLGSGGYVKHKPYFGGDKGTKLGCYSVAILNDGSAHVHWMYAKDIEAIKARSESVKAKKQSPWDSDPDEMWKKTVIKQHFKYLPKSERAEMAANAIAIENEANGIDFEKEKKADEKKNMSIDIMYADESENKDKFNSLKELLGDGVVPNVFKAGETEINVVATMEGMEKDFIDGNLHKEKFDKWDKYFRSVHAKFSKSKQDGK